MYNDLIEISGISFYKGNPDTVYAVQDEEGRVFRMAWGDRNAIQTKFGKKGDYEDLAIVQEMVYVLESNGTIISFPRADSKPEESAKEWKDLLPKGEYEGMYGDEAEGKLYVLCKDCDGDKKSVSVFLIDINDSLSRSSQFSIKEKDIEDFTKKLKSDFRPSALAKNPLTGDWFIVSGVNQLLVIADSSWNIKNSYHLSSKTFNQPEGIAFDNDGNLYISNEGDNSENGNILKFIHHK
jgi:uncharacterized protein YjiK